MVPPHFVAAPWQGKFFSDLMQPSPTKGENKLGDKKRKEFPTASRTQKANKKNATFQYLAPLCAVFRNGLFSHNANRISPFLLLGTQGLYLDYLAKPNVMETCSTQSALSRANKTTTPQTWAQATGSVIPLFCGLFCFPIFFLIPFFFREAFAALLQFRGTWSFHFLLPLCGS